MRRRLTTEEFVTRSIDVWGDRWNYSKTSYSTARKKVTIICKEHGEYSQLAFHHMAGRVGCSKCSGKFFGTSEFINKANAIWEGRWSYSEVDYVNNHTPVKIQCPLHGEFNQTPAEHYQSVGCPGCHGRDVDTETFIERAKSIWGDRWDYSKTVYASRNSTLIITCPLHGDFNQTPAGHYRGVGCPRCNNKERSWNKFISRAQETWGVEGYDYSLATYVDCRTPVTIRCVEHDTVFTQPPDSHYAGKVGCIKCRHTSRGEVELREFIQSLKMPAEYSTRHILSSGRELDVYLPEKSVAIEYNGVYWHSDKFRNRTYHQSKMQECASLGIRLLQIWEDDWRDRRTIVEEHIKQVLGVSSLPRYSARECEVRPVPVHVAREFLDQNHIQGWAASSAYVALYLRDKLVALASFKKQGEDLYLTRYATAAVVRGGHSKLISWVERTHSYRNLVTFADLTFSCGDLYKKTGWVLDKVIPPDYMYIKRDTRVHKFNFRLRRFKDDPDLQYREGMTEMELARLNKLLRVYDAGKMRFIKPHPILCEEVFNPRGELQP